MPDGPYWLLPICCARAELLLFPLRCYKPRKSSDAVRQLQPSHAHLGGHLAVELLHGLHIEGCPVLERQLAAVVDISLFRH